MRGSPLTLLCSGLTVILACSDAQVLGPPADPPEETTPAIPPPDPSFAISDAVHGGGNSHFFWLPSLVSAPVAFNGTFDATQDAEVEICDLSDCGANLIAHYTMSSGPGAEAVRVVPTDEHYIVNWHTNEFAIAPGATYRLRVLVAGTELGHADVQLGSTGSEVKNLTTNETIALKDGRTLAITFRIEEGAVFVIAPAEGGTITALDGTATLEVPPGALTEETGLTVESMPPADEQIAIVDLGPDGLTFPDDNPITVTLTYDENALGGVAEADLALNTLEDGEWIIVPGSSVDLPDDAVSAPFFHFSQASVGPAAKAIVCPGDSNPNTFDTFENAIAALMDGGTLTVCGGTHSVNNVFVNKPVIIEGKAGARPTLTNSGSRWGFLMNLNPVSGPTEVRNLRLVTDWAANSTNFSSMLRVLAGSDQVSIEDVEVHVVDSGSGIFVDMSVVPGASTSVRNATFTGGDASFSRQNGIYIANPAGGDSPVEVSDSEFTNLRRDLVVDQWQATSSRTTIDNVTINPGSGPAGPGIFGFSQDGSVQGPLVDVTNSSLVGHSVLYWRGTAGRIQGNTFVDCPGSCIEGGHDALTGPQAEPIRVIGNEIAGSAASVTHAAIAISRPSSGPFEVRDNQIGGVAPSDPADPTTYSFFNGIDIHEPGAAGVVTGNSVSSARNGLKVNGGTVQVTGSDNTFDLVHTGVWVFDAGQLSLHSTDVTGYQRPIHLDAASPDLTCNWWGHTDGPQGVDPVISAVVYTPWATASVAGSSVTSCSGGAPL